MKLGEESFAIGCKSFAFGFIFERGLFLSSVESASGNFID